MTKDSDVRDFLEGWELEMRAGYTPPNQMLTTLEEHAADWFEAFSDFGPSMRARLRSHTERFLENEDERYPVQLEPVGCGTHSHRALRMAEEALDDTARVSARRGLTGGAQTSVAPRADIWSQERQQS